MKIPIFTFAVFIFGIIVGNSHAGDEPFWQTLLIQSALFWAGFGVAALVGSFFPRRD